MSTAAIGTKWLKGGSSPSHLRAPHGPASRPACVAAAQAAIAAAGP
jgi:hypothetical protein